MKTRRLWTAAGIIAGVIVLLFVISVPRAQEVFEAVTDGQDVAPLAVTLRDTYRGKTHTLSGTVLAPDACATVEAVATANEGSIALALTLAEDNGVCLELPTSVSYSTQVEAAAGLPITVSVNGKEVTPERL